MSAYRWLTRPEVEKLFAPYGAHHVSTEIPGFELWETGWGEAFTLSLEYDGVHYDEWMCTEAIEKAMKPSMPSDWPLARG